VPGGTGTQVATYRSGAWRNSLEGSALAVQDEATIRVLVHRQNIHRYRFLLQTHLTDVECAFITRRIAEEEAEVRRLSASRRERSAAAQQVHASVEEPIEVADRFRSS
jgi:hypothetical protein